MQGHEYELEEAGDGGSGVDLMRVELSPDGLFLRLHCSSFAGNEVECFVGSQMLLNLRRKGSLKLRAFYEEAVGELPLAEGVNA
jgi:hypothetical protein